MVFLLFIVIVRPEGVSMRHAGFAISALLMSLLLPIGGVSADATEEDIWIFRGQPPTAEELADILFPRPATAAARTSGEDNPDSAGNRLRFRSIRFTDKTPSDPAKTSQAVPSTERVSDSGDAARDASDAERKRPGAFGFLIHFAFDSAQLPLESFVFLDRVAEVLKMERAAGAKLVVEGHTDAVGSENYNLRLSARRSEAVKQYLVDKHKIESSRLVTVAKGKAELLDRNEPTSSVNRRVQFRRAE